jgi:glycosyltransferase involved in cell wall biosynthesis
VPDLKISLVTVVFNAESTIERCIQSVIDQTFKNIEYIVIDGGSTDKTVEVINKFKKNIHYFLSEQDNGIYDAMNKGIKFATGDVVGMLNADDFLADNHILSKVAESFQNYDTQIVYGDLEYINDAGKIFRKWHSGKYTNGKFNWGWMPPHPTFYCKRELFNQFGLYSLDYGTAADYELMLRFIHRYHVNPYYLEKVMVKMKTGGVSNKSIYNRVKGLLHDFKAMRKHKIHLPLVTLFFKPLRKLGQYF